MKNNRRKPDLVHQHVRISSLRQSLYPVYDAIRCLQYMHITVPLSHGVASRCDILSCNKIDKPLLVDIFSNIMQ